MESLIFIVVAVALYIAADRLVERIERRAGRRLEHRTLLFFAILLVLALTSFYLIRLALDG